MGRGPRQDGEVLPGSGVPKRETVGRHGRRRPLPGFEAAAEAAVNDGGTAKAISPFWL